MLHFEQGNLYKLIAIQRSTCQWKCWSREREAQEKEQQRKKKKQNLKLLSFGEDEGESDAKENGSSPATRVKSLFEADVDDPRSGFCCIVSYLPCLNNAQNYAPSC